VDKVGEYAGGGIAGISGSEYSIGALGLYG